MLGVDDNAHGEREVLIHVEGVDGLGTIVDLKNEAVFGQVLDEGVATVVDDDGDVDHEGIGTLRRGGVSELETLSLLAAGACRTGPCAVLAAVRASSATKQAMRDMV